jgi:purine-nucleoside phosphorylase
MAEVHEAEVAVREWLGGRVPSVGLVLGSGLGTLVEQLADPVRVPFREIPHFPRAGVPGHGGQLVAGRLGGCEVLVQSGRCHAYEGHPEDRVVLPVRVFARLGVRTLVLTNAAGGIRRTLQPGTVMLIADHVNFTFRNPLVGSVLPGEDPFPDMSDPYDSPLRALARDTALRRGLPLAEGVYAGVLGPSYETPAEIRMLERFGADAVGMSTVLEVIAARAAGVRCLGFSVITNAAAGITTQRLSHAEVVETAGRAAGGLAGLIEGVVAAL